MVSLLNGMKRVRGFYPLGGVEVVLLASPFRVLLRDDFARFCHAGQLVDASENAIQLHSHLTLFHAVGCLVFASSTVS